MAETTVNGTTDEDGVPTAKKTRAQTPAGWVPGSVEKRAVSQALAPKSYDAEARTVEAVFATQYRVRRWFGWEELAITEEAINLMRVSMGQCRLLDHHNAYERDAVLGTVVEARVDKGQLVGKIRFADTNAGHTAEADVASGLLRGISVGYRVNKLVLAEMSEDDDDVYRVESWELMEVSLVSVPADPHAGTRGQPQPAPKPSAASSARARALARMRMREAQHAR